MFFLSSFCWIRHGACARVGPRQWVQQDCWVAQPVPDHDQDWGDSGAGQSWSSRSSPFESHVGKLACEGSWDPSPCSAEYEAVWVVTRDVKGVRFVQGELGSHSHRLCCKCSQGKGSCNDWCSNWNCTSDHQLWGCLQRLPNPDDEVHQGVGEVVFKAEDPWCIVF